MAETLAEQLAVEEVGPDEYMSKHLPTNMDIMPVAYGGCTLGLAVHAACHTVSPDFHLYSVLGYYLAPGLLTEKMKCTVERIRDTKSFSTRRVRVSQTAEGRTRVCMELTADFHIREEGDLEYSGPPAGQHPPPEKLQTNAEHGAGFHTRGIISQEQLEMHRTRTDPFGVMWDIRQCPDSVAGQNLHGLLNPKTTSQDHVPTGSKTSAEWARLMQPLETQAQHMSALAFVMDSGLSTLPMIHADVSLEEVAWTASLDFAFRLMQPVVDVTKWHLSERVTSSAAGGLTYAEGRLWDAQGKLVASMTQQSIFKKWKPAKSSL
ncbi:Thioesterase/thiol ester dehydrase-isomerase [Thozetella sp. PMI_491]|nr:Thioesterase/thiol ester dehydrase-isomerase [Thozetella sp. PMI_491]